MKAISTVLAFAVAVLGAAPRQSISNGTTPEIPTPNPCAVLSAYSASSQSSDPENTGITYRPSQVQACMRDVPINNTLAAEQITWIQRIVQFQSTLAYLKDPPPAYAMPAVDVVGRLDEIAAKAKAGKYQGQYEYERELRDVFDRTVDGHLNYSPFLTSGISYLPNQQVVSVSLDGHALPKVYILSDIQARYSDFANFTPSALVTINGQDVQSYLAQTGYFTGNQDLDAQYNAQFSNPATDVFKTAYFLTYFTSNDTNSFVFENGSVTTTQANAAFVSPLSVLGSGQAIFDTFIIANDTSSPTSSAASSAASATSSSSSSNTSIGDSSNLQPLSTEFPVPIMKAPGNYVSGYFLKDNPEIAVLVISSFGGPTHDSPGIQNGITRFLAECRRTNKKKLIIDTRGNNGGLKGLAYDTFKQLFPSLVPYSGDRIRLSKATTIMASIATQAGPDGGNYLSGTFWDALNSLKTPDGPRFQSYSQLFDPVEVHGDNFSHVAADYWGSIEDDVAGAGIVVSGYANMTNISSQVFRGEDIILFSDGNCPSTCAIFANLLINQGHVRTAAVGGRPNTSPMAVIGGVQGTEALYYDSLSTYVDATLNDLNDNTTNTTLDRAASIALLTPILASPPLSYFPGGEDSVMVNLLDGIAEGDETQTPLQFTRGKDAECRFWYMPRDILSVEYTWTRLARGFWGNNGKGLCIGGAVSVAGAEPTPTNGSFSSSNGTAVGGSTGMAPACGCSTEATSGPTPGFSPWILPVGGGRGGGGGGSSAPAPCSTSGPSPISSPWILPVGGGGGGGGGGSMAPTASGSSSSTTSPTTPTFSPILPFSSGGRAKKYERDYGFEMIVAAGVVGLAMLMGLS